MAAEFDVQEWQRAVDVQTAARAVASENAAAAVRELAALVESGRQGGLSDLQLHKRTGLARATIANMVDGIPRPGED